jgi:hypothetical protein
VGLHIKRFAELISQYRRLHPDEDIHPFVNVIQRVVKEHKTRQPAVAALNIAAAQLLDEGIRGCPDKLNETMAQE